MHGPVERKFRRNLKNAAKQLERTVAVSAANWVITQERVNNELTVQMGETGLNTSIIKEWIRKGWKANKVLGISERKMTYKYEEGELVKVWRLIQKNRWGAYRKDFKSGDMGIVLEKKPGMSEPVYKVLIQRTGEKVDIFEKELNYKFTKKMRKGVEEKVSDVKK
jgi:hypothetical protein